MSESIEWERGRGLTQHDKENKHFARVGCRVAHPCSPGAFVKAATPRRASNEQGTDFVRPQSQLTYYGMLSSSVISFPYAIMIFNAAVHTFRCRQEIFVL